MKYILNALLVAIILFLIYMLVNSIKEPIAFREEKVKREIVVIDRLKEIRKAQEIYREITGEFAGNWDTLVYVLMNDSIPFEYIVGDPDDPENLDKIIRTITYSAAYDSIKSLGINLERLRYVPFAPEGTIFDITADTLTYQQTMVHVVEVGTRYNAFMGDYADAKFSKYDSRYSPNNRLKFGDLSKPNLTGNWE